MTTTMQESHTSHQQADKSSNPPQESRIEVAAIRNNDGSISLNLGPLSEQTCNHIINALQRAMSPV